MQKVLIREDWEKILGYFVGILACTVGILLILVPQVIKNNYEGDATSNYFNETTINPTTVIEYNQGNAATEGQAHDPKDLHVCDYYWNQQGDCIHDLETGEYCGDDCNETLAR